MITKKTLVRAMHDAMQMAATRLPPDVEAGLIAAQAEEVDELTKLHFESTLENARLSAAGEGLVCADTGFPLSGRRDRMYSKISVAGVPG